MYVQQAAATLPTMVGNASTAFPASLLSASSSLSNHFFKTPTTFGGEPSPPPHPPKTPVMARTIFEIVMDRAVSIENIVMPCSLNRIRILSANDVSWSRIFSMVCLILATCVWRSFRFCDNISSLVCSNPVPWYLSWCVFINLCQVRSYLTVDPVCFVKPYQYQRILTYRGWYFAMLLVL